MNKLLIALSTTMLILLALAISGCNEVEEAKEVEEAVVTTTTTEVSETKLEPTIVVSPAVNTARELESIVNSNKPEVEENLEITVDTEQ